jgi:hypothetical protein
MVLRPFVGFVVRRPVSREVLSLPNNKAKRVSIVRLFLPLILTEITWTATPKLKNGSFCFLLFHSGDARKE